MNEVDVGRYHDFSGLERMIIWTGICYPLLLRLWGSFLAVHLGGGEIGTRGP